MPPDGAVTNERCFRITPPEMRASSGKTDGDLMNADHATGYDEPA
jgi:hypothetical protein